MSDFFQDEDEIASSSSTSSLSPQYETCPLCLGRTKLPTCEICVRAGNFSHSKRNHPESYCEKVKKLEDLKRVKEAFQTRVIEVIRSREALQKLSDEVLLKRERMMCLQEVVGHAQDNLKQDLHYLESVKKENSLKRTRLKSSQEELKKLVKERDHYLAKLSESKQDLLKVQDELRDVRRTSVTRIQQYLFPIQAIPVYPVMGTPPPHHTPDDMELSEEIGYDMEDQGDESVESALAEATRTSYVEGRWVSQEVKIEYSIVDGCLPGNGDYSAYSVWVKAHRNGSKGPEEEVGLRDPAYTISAGLTHTAQLVELLAYYFDVNLPKRLSYSEFCHNEMNRKEFKSAFSRLNTNVLHVCFSQHVDPTLLHPHRTLHNLYALLNSATIGRSGAFECHPELLSINDEHDESNQSDFGSSTEEELNSEDETDWETFPKNLDIPEAPPLMDNTAQTQSMTSQSMSLSLSSSGHDSAAEEMETGATMSLVSSAAASVAALWPWKR